MADRYTRIYIDEKEKYCVGTPIIISACALLHDNKTDGIVAQVKLKNIGEKIIKAVKVLVEPLDTAGRSLSDGVSYSFLDLNAKRDDYLGTQNAIPMPDYSTRSIEIKITEIIYLDNTVVDTSQNDYKLIPERRTLSSLLGDEEIVKQYKIKTTERAIFEPVKFDNLWLCTCSAINDHSEDACHICGVNFQKQITDLDKSVLANEAQERKSEEELNRKSIILQKAKDLMASDNIFDYETAISELVIIRGFENADELIGTCEEKISEQKIAIKKKKRKTKILVISISIMTFLVVSALFLWIYEEAKIAKRTELKNELELFLSPLVCVDPPDCDSVDELPSTIVLESAIWKIILTGNNSNYEKLYNTYMYVPAIDVEFSVRSIFGNSVKIEHQTVGTMDITFTYIEDINSYQVPINPRYITYSPQLKDVMNDGELYTVTVEYIPPSDLAVEGIEFEVKPQKTMVYTLLKSKTSTTLQSIKNITSLDNSNVY